MLQPTYTLLKTTNGTRIGWMEDIRYCDLDFARDPTAQLRAGDTDAHLVGY